MVRACNFSTREAEDQYLPEDPVLKKQNLKSMVMSSGCGVPSPFFSYPYLP